jgi:hypothetical protein
MLLSVMEKLCYNGPEWIPVDRAVEAGKLANMPVMIDFGVSNLLFLLKNCI